MENISRNFNSFFQFLEKQNTISPFAKRITSRGTVYFTDEFAAGYDAMIFPIDGQKIFIQESIDEEFDAYAAKTWLSLTNEVWIVHPALEWIKRVQTDSTEIFQREDLFTSTNLPGLVFKLVNIV